MDVMFVVIVIAIEVKQSHALYIVPYVCCEIIGHMPVYFPYIP